LMMVAIDQLDSLNLRYYQDQNRLRS
jgi:hypothetical protein